MKIISHRGNLFGPEKELENTKKRIDEVIALGLDVEVDVRVVGGSLFLGHDSPEEEVSEEWILDRSDKLWIHCKNMEAIDLFLGKDANYFWHQEDDCTLTSKGYVWVYPGKSIPKNSVAVLPELWTDDLNLKCFGVCSDFAANFKKLQDLP